MRFKFKISHVPGKPLVTEYTLFRAPLQIVSKKITTRTIQFVNTVKSFPATKERINEIKLRQAYLSKNREPIKPYFPFAAELRVVDGLLFPGNTNC